MTLRKILIEPNPILRQVSEPVAKVGEEERKLMDDMLQTMYEAKVGHYRGFEYISHFLDIQHCTRNTAPMIPHCLLAILHS